MVNHNDEQVFGDGICDVVSFCPYSVGSQNLKIMDFFMTKTATTCLRPTGQMEGAMEAG